MKSILKRKDDPNAQPVVFIATYNVDIIPDNSREVEKILPTIPPQNVIVTVPASGGVSISWDRNPERNIKFYTVERSISNGSYVQIATTIDTVITDSEVQKAVKTYQDNRQNVTVRYRVRAKSQWFDDDGTTQSQFSDYSDIITIQGSIIAIMDKLNVAQIVPENNSISQNFPNPFNPTTTIYYSVKEPSNVKIKVYNSLGQDVATLVDGVKEIGYHYAEWNASSMPSGIYFYAVTVKNKTETKKMILTKLIHFY